MQLMVYFMTVRVMQSRKHKHAPSDKFFLLFTTIILLLNTVFVATEAVFGEEMWVVNADYEGGMDAYLFDFASVWYQTFGTAASIVLNLLSDGLLVCTRCHSSVITHTRLMVMMQIYRCWVVWDDLRVIVFPAIVYLASFCTFASAIRGLCSHTHSTLYRQRWASHSCTSPADRTPTTLLASRRISA